MPTVSVTAIAFVLASGVLALAESTHRISQGDSSPNASHYLGGIPDNAAARIKWLTSPFGQLIHDRDDVPPKEMPPEVIAAWQKVGATYGWLGKDGFQLVYRDGNEGRAGEVPGFILVQSNPGVKNLPAPPQGFGLNLRRRWTFLDLE